MEVEFLFSLKYDSPGCLELGWVGVCFLYFATLVAVEDPR